MATTAFPASNPLAVSGYNAGNVATLALTVADAGGSALAISGTPGPGTQNAVYSFTPSTSGGSGTKVFSYTGTLQTGLTFDTTTGAIAGTSSISGTRAVTITVTDASGSASLGPFNIVMNAAVGPSPVNTALPTTASAAAEGVSLATTNGTWDNSPTSYTYQWRRAGTPITGATSQSYLPVTADVGSVLSCAVTATNGGGSTTAVTAATTAVTAAGIDGYETLFDNAAGALNTDTDWTFVSGTAGNVTFNGTGDLSASDATTDGTVYMSKQLFDTQDHWCEAAVSGAATNVGTNATPFICCRLTDFNNYIGARYVKGSTPTYGLFKKVGGTLTSLGTYSVTPVNGDVFRLVVSGTIAKVFVNGVERISASIGTAPPASNRQGIVARGFAIPNWITRYKASTLADLTQDATDRQTYRGGYIEIQPDSFTTGTPAMAPGTVEWGFPVSLTSSEQTRLKNAWFPGGGKGLKFLRLPLGFAYRGYRNIDGTSGLAKNIGERFTGQSAALTALLANVVAEGGGLMPEYWSPPPHWKTGSTYGQGTLWAGGANARTVTLDSIRLSDPTGYAAQITAFTDAIVNDLEYLHANVAPVRGFGLQNEPVTSASYGSCTYTSPVYLAVMKSLIPKIRNSAALSTWGGQANTVLIHANSWSGLATGSAGDTIASDTEVLSTGKTVLQELWAASMHYIDSLSADADNIRINQTTLGGTALATRFVNEFEYFTPGDYTDDFRCSNTMLQMVHSLAYLNAPVVMPIIHLAKPLGQLSQANNTLGYGLVKARLPDPFGEDPTTTGDEAPNVGYGAWDKIAPNWNAGKMVLDNIVAGSVVRQLTGGVQSDGAGWVSFTTAGGKRGALIVNRSSKALRTQLTLGGATLNGKRYNAVNEGAALGSVVATAAKIVVPAYSGEAWVEA